MDGPGGMITAFLKGGLDDARRFLERVRIFALAESLGGVESLIEHPAIMTHATIPAETRARKRCVPARSVRRSSDTMPPKPFIWRRARPCCGCDSSPG